MAATAPKLAVVGWGSTFGPIHQAVRRALADGKDVAHVHVRHIWPPPKNLGALLKGFERILVPEMNMGQYKTLLRDQYLVDAQPLTKVSGHPFRIAEIEAAIERALTKRAVTPTTLAIRMKPINVWSMVHAADRRHVLIIWLRPHG